MVTGVNLFALSQIVRMRAYPTLEQIVQNYKLRVHIKTRQLEQVNILVYLITVNA
jgi:hypothetical protein